MNLQLLRANLLGESWRMWISPEIGLTQKFAKPPFANGGFQIRLGMSLALFLWGGFSWTKRASVILQRPKTSKSQNWVSTPMRNLHAQEGVLWIAECLRHERSRTAHFQNTRPSDRSPSTHREQPFMNRSRINPFTNNRSRTECFPSKHRWGHS